MEPSRKSHAIELSLLNSSRTPNLLANYVTTIQYARQVGCISYNKSITWILFKINEIIIS